MKKYDDEQAQDELGSNSYWEVRDGKLYRRLIFEDFIHAFGFITQIAMLAEKHNHHPEWANIYRTVDIFLTTHEAGGISDRDFLLLEAIDKLVATA